MPENVQQHIQTDEALAVQAAGSVMDYMLESKLRAQAGEVRKAAERWCEAYDTVRAHIAASHD